MNIFLFTITSIILFFLPSSVLAERLNFHVGVADVYQITGYSFDLESLKKIPLYVFMGDQDTNDQVPFGDAYDDTQREQVNRLFGYTPLERWPYAEQIYSSVGLNAKFVLYPGVAHKVSLEMCYDIGQFFIKNGTTSGDSRHENYEVIKVLPTDSTKEFYWPYYLKIPVWQHAISTTLLVEGNNTGFTSDNPVDHDKAAFDQITSGYAGLIAENLSSPLLIPTFPRPHTNWKVYTHALDRDTLITDLPMLKRIDLQMIEMINDARDRLAARNVNVGSKVFMLGFSASGTFVNRFTFLHPELIQAAAIGSPGGWPIAPVVNWPPGSRETFYLPFLPILLKEN